MKHSRPPVGQKFAGELASVSICSLIILNLVPLLKCKAGKCTEHGLKSQRGRLSCGRLSDFSEPHFGHLHKGDSNGLWREFNYRHS